MPDPSATTRHGNLIGMCARRGEKLNLSAMNGRKRQFQPLSRPETKDLRGRIVRLLVDHEPIAV